MLNKRQISLLFCLAFFLSSATTLSVDAAEPPSAVGSMLKLLKSGKIPEQRLGAIVKLICDRGNEHDLKFIFDQIVDDKNWPADLRSSSLRQLSDASTTRNVAPAGDLSAIASLMKSNDQHIRETSIQLAGQWKVTSAYEVLNHIATSEESSSKVRTGSLLAMAKISPEKTNSLLKQIAENGETFSQRSMAVQVLALIDVETAAKLASKVLKVAGERDDPATLLDGFLDQEKGSVILAKAIEATPPAPDTAKLALRHMFSIGRTDQELSAVLSKIAGIAGDPKPPTKEELAAIIKEVNEQGNAARGETVFRRKDLSCMKCHAVSKAGGQIGPDLSAIGASSPIDYVVMSVLDPDQAIKEAYTTRVVITTRGRIHQGLVADRTANALVLKDATGKETSIPIDDIDDEVEGKSLMPKGLVKFMTHAEFIDLAKFLSMLGKPGDYAVRSTQRMQRWKVLTDVPQGLIDETPTLSTFEDLVLRATTWQPVYSRVNGDLPLGELIEKTSQPVVYVQGELNVATSGKIEGRINSSEGLTLWIDDEQIEFENSFEFESEPGLHQVTFRVDTNVRQSDDLNLEFHRPGGSKAEFTVVDGQ